MDLVVLARLVVVELSVLFSAVGYEQAHPSYLGSLVPPRRKAYELV